MDISILCEETHLNLGILPRWEWSYETASARAPENIMFPYNLFIWFPEKANGVSDTLVRFELDCVMQDVRHV